MNYNFNSNNPAQANSSATAQKISQSLILEHDANGFSPFASLNDKTYLGSIESIYNDYFSQFEHLVVLGTGGSALAGMTLCFTQIAFQTTGGIYGATATNSAGKTITFCPNFDDTQMSAVLSGSLSKTAFLVVSKSGETLETTYQAIAAIQALSTQSLDPAKHVFYITSNQSSTLFTQAVSIGAQIFSWDYNVSGRYSCFTKASMIPARFFGFDCTSFFAAASEAYTAFKSGHYRDRFSQIITTLEQGQCNIFVNVCYDSSLSYLNNWYSQLWSESIGKSGNGTTITTTYGPMDQHSQLQLWMDGPKDKLYTFFYNNQSNLKMTPNKDFTPKSFATTLIGKTVSEVVHAQYKATFASIAQHSPTRSYEYTSANASFLGQMMAEWILETVVACKFTGINAYNQPAVEQVKQDTIAILSTQQSTARTS